MVKKNNSEWMSYLLFLFVIILSVVLRPAVELDLTKYYAQLDILNTYSFLYMLKNTSITSCIIDTLFWLISKSGIYQFLPFMTALIVYGATLYISLHSNKFLHKKANKILFYWWILFLSTTSFGFVIANVRNVIAFSILGIALYRDKFLKKFNAVTIFLYVIPCGIHISALVIILVRIILPFYKMFRFLGIGIILGIPIIVKQLYYFLSQFNLDTFFMTIIWRFIDKAYYYFFDFNDTWKDIVLNSGFQKAQKTFIFFILLALQFIVILIHKKKNFSIYQNYIAIVELLGFITLSSFYISVPTYLRFMVLYMILYTPLFFLIACYDSYQNVSSKILCSCYIPISIGGIALQLYYLYFNFTIL